jgi:TonB-linked SusC/RagA family outer membrane protein
MKKIMLWVILLHLSGTMALYAQKMVSGVVTDNKNEPLIGATVVIKGTNQGTVTDTEGKYNIDVPDENAVLVISFVGYLTEEITVGNQSVISTSLIQDITGLEEVVVIGYGTVRKRDLTAPVASVNSEQIKDIPLASTAQALTGRLAGVQITTSEGSPDAEVKIRVRGGGSITQSNDPLYIVDGFPVEGINDIAPTDIESIDVLKDASSTAIYGARGANGVVIVTTKSGKKGQTRINYNTYYGKKKLANKLDVLDPYEFVLYQYELSRGSFPERKRFEDLYGTWDQLDSLYSNAEGTDWQEEVFGRNATTFSHNLSISGGTEKVNYNLSYTNNTDEGIMIESGYKRNNLNFRFQTEASKKIQIDFEARYSDLRVMGAGTSDPSSSSQNRLKHSVVFRPINGLSDFTNDPDLFPGFSDDDYYTASQLANPVQLTKDEYRKQNRIISNFNTALTYEIVKDLKFRSEIGYDTRQDLDDRFYGITTYLARRYGDEPVVRIAKDLQSRIRTANTLNYSLNNIKNNHDLSFLLGQELVHTKKNKFSQETQSFSPALTPELALGNLSLGENPQPANSSESLDKLLSFFGRINYNYRDKYLVQISLRADGSSKFWAQTDNNWGLFPSGSVAWRISEENFMKNITLISSLKLRLSYGQAGNNRIDDYLFLDRFTTSDSKPYFLNENRLAYLYKPTPQNPDLKWETAITRDVGLDLGLFKERFHVTADYYYNSGIDLLLDVPIDPSSTGYSSQIQNIGKTSNYGFETVIDAYIIDRKDFKISASFNISFNHNRVDKIREGVDEILWPSEWNADPGYDYLVRVGEPVGLMYGFVTDGFYTVDDFEIDPETGEFLLDDQGGYILKPGVANNENITFAGFGPGAYKFRDLADPIDSLGNTYEDGNLVTFEDDRTVIGNANPKHIGGLNIMAQYKWFDLSIFLNWVYGNDIYNANKIEFTSGYYPYRNLLNEMNSGSRWMTVNESGEVVTNPEELAALNENATIWKPPTGRYLFHSFAVEDGSFLRINNVTFGVTIPKKWLHKIFIQNLRFYFTANNLYTFTRYSGYDPEVDTRRDTPLTPNVDYSAYPRSRMYLVGLNLTL